MPSEGITKSISNKSYYRRNRDKILERRKRRHEVNREEDNKRARHRHEANREEDNKRARHRHEANREEDNKRARIYSAASYTANPEWKKQQSAANYTANPDQKKQQSRDRAQERRSQAQDEQLGGQYNQESVDGLNLSIETTESVKKAKQADQITFVDGKTDIHRARVCLVCDRIIFGTSSFYNIEKDKILEHRHKLGVDSYEEFYAKPLKEELVKQYEVEGFEGLLLSKRARNDGTKYNVCYNCFNAIRSSNVDSNVPPKYSIANGFCIGSIPQTITTVRSNGETEHTTIDDIADLTETFCAFLSPKRAYAYVFAYTGGHHKSVKGHYSFFEVNQNHVGQVLHHYENTKANPMVYCVLCGRMTPKQKEIARQKAVIDTGKLIKVFTWFITQSGHSGFRRSDSTGRLR